MPWVRLDDKFHSNQKVLSAGLSGAGLYAMALSYCGDHLTDGFVPYAWARAHGSSRVMAKLVEVGLWCPADGGFHIPDFLEIGNRSRSEVESKRKADRIRKESARSRIDVAPPQSQSQSRPITTGSQSSFKDLDDERRRELERILNRVSNADSGTPGVLATYGRKLPFGALAKVRESIESQPSKMSAGWAVNALKDEIRERAA